MQILHKFISKLYQIKSDATHTRRKSSNGGAQTLEQWLNTVQQEMSMYGLQEVMSEEVSLVMS